jgi:hypothetical protein
MFSAIFFLNLIQPTGLHFAELVSKLQGKISSSVLATSLKLPSVQYQYQHQHSLQSLELAPLPAPLPLHDITCRDKKKEKK